MDMTQHPGQSPAPWSHNYNEAAPQQSYDLIPAGTVVRVHMTLKPGGFNDPVMNLTGGYATRNSATGSVYLKCEFAVLEGAYAKQKLGGLIGLYSPKGPKWGDMGRSFIRGILGSSRGFGEKDRSPQAVAARGIESFADLDGIAFTARIDVEEDSKGIERNEIRVALTKDHKDYPGNVPATQTGSQAIPSALPHSSMLPSWAR